MFWYETKDDPSRSWPMLCDCGKPVERILFMEPPKIYCNGCLKKDNQAMEFIRVNRLNAY